MIIEKKIRLLFWIVGISLFFSILAIIFSIVHIKPFTIEEATYIGIIVSFMGIIFTIFVGYQIYNVIEVKKDLKDLTQQREKLEKSISQLSDFQKIMEAYNFSNKGCFGISMKQYENAVLFFLNSLKTFLLSDNWMLHLSDIDGIIGNIEHCIYHIQKSESITINEDIESILAGIKNTRNYSHLNKNLKDRLLKLANTYTH